MKNFRKGTKKSKMAIKAVPVGIKNIEFASEILPKIEANGYVWKTKTGKTLVGKIQSLTTYLRDLYPNVKSVKVKRTNGKNGRNNTLTYAFYKDKEVN